MKPKTKKRRIRQDARQFWRGYIGRERVREFGRDQFWARCWERGEGPDRGTPAELARIKLPKIGQFVSIWERATRRHKWRIYRPFVLVTFIPADERGISWQESDSGGGTSTGWTSAQLGDCRKIGRPQFDVRPRA